MTVLPTNMQNDNISELFNGGKTWLDENTSTDQWSISNGSYISPTIDVAEVKKLIGEAIKEYAKKFKWNGDDVDMNLTINIDGKEAHVQIKANNEESSEMIKEIILVEKMSV